MNPLKVTAAGGIELLESVDCRSGGLFVRAHEHNRVFGALRERNRELQDELERLKLTLVGIWFETPWAGKHTGEELKELGERYGRYQERLCKGILELIDAAQHEPFGSQLQASDRLDRAIEHAQTAVNDVS